MGSLRLLLALCVVTSHSSTPFGLTLLPGGHAVYVFFLISGFLAGFVLDNKYKDRWAVFYVNRLQRVWPLYLLVVIGTALMLGLAASLNGRLLGPLSVWAVVHRLPAPGWLVAGYLSQIFILGQEAFGWMHLLWDGGVQVACSLPGSLRMDSLMLLPQAWSLSLEEYFYLTAPWLRRLSLTASLAVFGLGLAGFALSSTCYLLPGQFALTALPLFVGGLASHRLYQAWCLRGRPLAAWGRRLAGAYLASMLLAAYIPFLMHPPVLLAWSVLCLPFVFDLFRDKAWDRWLGDLSYPLYLCHVAVGWALQWLWPDLGQTFSVGLAVIPASLAVAVLLTLTVERPLRKRRRLPAGTAGKDAPAAGA